MGFEYQCRFRKESIRPTLAFPNRHSILRPIVRLKIVHQEASIEVMALIDSGADTCLFDAEIGEAIGIPIEEGKIEQTKGVADQRTDVYYHDVEIEVREKRWKARVGFVRSLGIGALAGREGFFTKFKVCLDQSRAITTLTE